LSSASIPRRKFRLGAAAGLLLFVGCAPALTTKDLPLGGARLQRLHHEIRDGAGGETDLGWLELLYGDQAAALAHFDRAAPDPLALLGRAVVVAGARGSKEEEAEAWLDLVSSCGSRSGGAGRVCPVLMRVALQRLSALDAGHPSRVRGVLGPLARAKPLLGEAVQLRDLALGLVARLERREGAVQQVERLDRQRGCFRSWRVSGPHHRNAHVDLSQPVSHGQSYRDLPSTQCRIQLRSESKWGGIYWITTEVVTSRPRLIAVTVVTPNPWQLLVSGRVVHTHGMRRAGLAQRVTLQLRWPQGRHRLGLKVGSPTGYAETTLTAVPLDGGPPVELTRTDELDPPPAMPPAIPVPCVEMPELPAVWYAPLGTYLAAAQALHCGDWDRVYRELALAQGWAPRFAAPRLLMVQALLADPLLPSQVCAEEAIRLLRSMLARDPTSGAAMSRLADLLLRQGEVEPALKLYRAGALRWPGGAMWQEGLHRAYREHSYAVEQELALERAVALAPRRCDLVEQLAGLKRLHKDVEGMLRLTMQARGCDAQSALLARFLRRAGRLKQAVREYRRILWLRPDATYLRRELVQTLHLLRREGQARAELRRILGGFPGSVEDWIELADLWGAQGAHTRRASPGVRAERGEDTRRAVDLLQRAHASMPWETDLRRTLERLTGRSVMQPYRIDGRKVVAAYQHGATQGDTPAVGVQDRLVTRFFADGSSLNLTHNIVELLTKEGIERWGEVELPRGADLLTLRTIKADGSVREPEELLGKRTVSLPGLERGDFVEIEYVDASPPPRAFDGALGSRFFFASFDLPLVLSEYVIVAPRGLPITVDRRGGVQPARRQVKGEMLHLRWVVRNQDRVVAEPSSAPVEEYLPSVRVSARASWEHWRDYYLEQVVQATRATWLTAQLARKVVPAGAGARERAEALYRWTLKEVEAAGPVLASAAAAVAARRGSRYTVLVSLLQQAGVAAELWLVRPVSAAGGRDGAVVEAEGLRRALVRCMIDGHAVFLQPEHRHVPFGYVDPDLRGALALPLAREQGRPILAWIPRTLAGSIDQRQLRLRALVTAGGAGRVTAVERIDGLPAQQWRQQLERIDRSRLKALFEQQYLGVNVPGASLDRLVVVGQRGSGTLELRYDFRVPNLCRLQSRRLRCNAGVFAPNLRRRYLGLARRRLPLLVGFHPPSIVELELVPPRGFALSTPAAPVRLTSKLGSLDRRTTRLAGEVVRVETRLSIAQRRVDPAIYPAFSSFAARVDQAHELELEFAPTGGVGL